MKLPLLIYLLTAAVIFETWQYNQLTKLEGLLEQNARAHNVVACRVLPELKDNEVCKGVK